jgi:hypothetical protein
VSGYVVMVEKPTAVLLHVWTFMLNVLPQPLQNLTVKLSDGKRYKFLVDSSLDAEKKINMDLTLLRT